jgi:UDP-N-acetylmuramoyl-tripeptide--D-alanyl-D-alanine ligase
MLSNSWSWIAFALMRIRPGQRHAVIEVGISKPGLMKGYARTVGPEVAVITAIGSEHHRSLGTLEVTRAEKSWMVQVLPASGTAVLNGDDPNVMWMKEKTRARVVTFGFGATCDVRADEIRLDWPRGTCFRLTAFGEERDVAVRLLGRHMIYPILAAVAVSHVEGYALDPALARLRELAPTPGRMDPVLLPNGVTVLRDDFKSTLETVHTALDVLAQIPASRRVVLLGSVSEPPGPQRPMYQALGERVAEIASHLVLFHNEFEPYWSGARRGGMPRTSVTNAGRSARDAAEALSQLLQPGDVLLIKGRGPEKLDRVRLILEGRRVGCDIRYCSLRTQECGQCPMLERGWEGHRVIM